MKCAQCGAELTRDEVGLSCKLISRTAENCRCLRCLSTLFHIDAEQLQALAEHFRAAGCTLFR